jgi:hypothetical protein
MADGGGVVAAHIAKQSHAYVIHFPAHPARTDDPHFKDFDHYHRTTRASARCYTGERVGFQDCRDAQGNPCTIDAAGQQAGLELHHAHVEFALQQGISLAALEHDYPGISNPDEVGAWVETAANLRWICVLPDTPVLMAEGGERPVQDVSVGDQVIGKDGWGHPVVAIGRKRYCGPIVSLSPRLTLTADHRVMTSRGWLPAAEIATQLRVLGEQMLAVRGVENEVLRPVVRFDPVLVMHSFGTPVRASAELLLADLADQHRRLRWLTVGFPVRTAHYDGWVHDLSVAHSQSFVAGGIVVHNCVFHHRTNAGGAHSVSHSDWEGSLYVRGLTGDAATKP